MLGHLGINVPDLVEAKRYYDRIMPLLDFVQLQSSEGEFAYCPAEGKPGTYVFFYRALEESGYSRHRIGLQHFGFKVPTRSAVDAVHRCVIDLGSEVVAGPKPYPRYTEHYYAVFWLDPYGFMWEAHCVHDRP